MYVVGILASAALYIHTCYTYIVFCIGGPKCRKSSLYTEAYCSAGRKLDAYVRTVDSLRSQQSTTTKGGFFQKLQFVFQISKKIYSKNYPELEI